MWQIRWSGALSALTMVVGCGSPVASQKNAQPTPEPTYKAVDGYGDFPFGSSFEHLIGSVNDAAEVFNSYGLKICFRDLADKGCSLTRGDKMFTMVAGIPYYAGATFNNLDELTDFKLGYRREGAITHDGCAHVLARTIDWLSKDYGPLTWQPHKSSEKATSLVVRKSPDGNRYAIVRTEGESDFVSEFHFSPNTKWQYYEEDGKRLRKVTTRSIKVFAHYLTISGQPMCDVSVDFSEPASVPRPPDNVEDLE